MFKCSRCEFSNETYDGLRRHTSKFHKIHASDLYIEVVLKGIPPVCKCGCSERPNWRAGKFQEYVNGHNARGDTNPIHMLTDDQWITRKAKHSATNKAQFAAGTRKIWSKGRHIETDTILQGAAKKLSENKERANKISNALKGVPKTEEHKQKMWTGHKKWLQGRQNKSQTTPERNFVKILIDAEIPYQPQFDVNGFLFDFLISNTTMLVEVDGDFFHCHPIKFPSAIYETQRVTLANDAKKTIAANRLGYTVLRFWETDINTRPEWVMSELKSYLEL